MFVFSVFFGREKEIISLVFVKGKDGWKMKIGLIGSG